MPSSNGLRPDRGELIAVRHAQSLANVAFEAAERSGSEIAGLGWRDADVPLSAAGRRQAVALGQWIRAHPPEVVYCSPYRRARQTWQLASGELYPAQRQVPVVLDERLGDREMGKFELLTPAVIERRFPQEAARRAVTGEFRYRPPGGESLADVAERIRGFLQEADLARRPLVMTHDAAVLMMRYVTESLPVAQLLRLPPAANASITRWTAQSGLLRLTAYSDVSHLDPGPEQAAPEAEGSDSE